MYSQGIPVVRIVRMTEFQYRQPLIACVHVPNNRKWTNINRILCEAMYNLIIIHLDCMYLPKYTGVYLSINARQ